MQISNPPGKLVLPFANSGAKNGIPVNSQIGITAGAASLTDGFPPLTMTPVAAGGIPPSGLDMNGVLYEISAVIRWANAGGGYVYDSAFATSDNVSGYPKGARVLRTDGTGYWLNTEDNNEVDPESEFAADAGWVPDFTYGVAAVTMTSSNVTLTPLQYGKPVVVVSGLLTSDLNLIFPSIGGEWTIIDNTTGDFTVTAKTAAGAGVALEGVSLIVCDGTNILSSNSYAVPAIATIAKLREFKSSSVYAYVAGYYAKGDGGGGFYYADVSDTVSADNGGSIIVSTTGVRWKLLEKDYVTDRQFGSKVDGVTDDTLSIQATIDYAASAGLRCVLTNGNRNITDGINCPDNLLLSFAPSAWIVPTQHSQAGAILSNVQVLPKARSNITIVNPQIDGSNLPFVGSVRANDNGIGFATGVSKLRVTGGHIKGFRANFDNGPGGKGVGFEEGVEDVIVDGTLITDCTYATFVSPTLSDSAKYCRQITFSNLHVKRCAAIAWLLGDDSTPGALPTTDPLMCSASYFNITAEDCGHFPDRPVTTYRAKTAPILLQGFSNLLMRGVRISNAAGYPSVAHPAGGTQFPTGYPAAGQPYFGAGLSGPIGAVVWGWGRNIDIDVEFTGEVDDVWNIQHCRAHGGDSFGGSISPVGSFGNSVRIVKRGAALGIINSGVIGTTGTLAAATSTTVTFPNSSNILTRNNSYAGVTVTITGGTGSGQSRPVASYVGSTRVATMETAWSVTPDATSTFTLGSTTAVASAEINGRATVICDSPSLELVNNSARFPTNFMLTAESPTGIVIAANLFEVFSYNNSFGSGSTTLGAVYTPTITNITNVSTSAALEAKVFRIGSVVMVSGNVTFTPTAIGLCELELTLFAASNLSASTQVAGVCSDASGVSGIVLANTVNDKAKIQYAAASTSGKTVAYSYAYNLL